MNLLLIAHDFDFSNKDGIGRVSYEFNSTLNAFNYPHQTLSYGEMSALKRDIILPTKIRKINPDIIHLLQPEGGSFAFKAKKGVIKILTLHDSPGAKLHYTKNAVLSWYDIRRKDIAIRNADILICVSSLIKEGVVDYINKKGYKNKIIKVINLGLDKKFIFEPAYYGLRKDFVYIGSIHFPEKNIEDLLELYKLIITKSPNSYLHIFTSSPNPISHLKDKTDIPIYLDHKPFDDTKGIILHYQKSDEDIIPILKSATALIHLSKVEGFGLPILEALALGTPVLTLDIGKIPYELKKFTISDNLNGLLTQSLKLIEGMNTTAVSEGITYAKSQTWERFTNSIIEIYNQLPVHGEKTAF